jgi:hypothetical protein
MVQRVQSAVYKSADAISLWQFSLHFGLNVQFITLRTIDVGTKTIADLVAADYSRRTVFHTKFFNFEIFLIVRLGGDHYGGVPPGCYTPKEHY